MSLNREGRYTEDNKYIFHKDESWRSETNKSEMENTRTEELSKEEWKKE